MTKASRILLGSSLVLFVASLGTCFFGERYALSKIPPEQLKKMGDTDWIGAEWIAGGGILLLLSAVLALVPPILWLFRRLLRRRYD
jgi:hypothetical protein